MRPWVKALVSCRKEFRRRHFPGLVFIGVGGGSEALGVEFVSWGFKFEGE